MNIIIDNQIVKIFAHDATKIVKNPFISNLDNSISFRWPSLFEYLGLGSILSNLPAFDQTTPLFTACISTLFATKDKEALFYVYDRLFAENLNHINSLPQINAAFLLQTIKEQREKASFLEAEKVLSPVLAAYEAALVEKASHTMHHLILYLAWDRMCVWIGRLFNYQSVDQKFIKGLDVLKECLIESYQHIAQQGRTSPGIFRMLETLFFYQMREENLQKHTDAEWIVLSQSFHALKAQDELLDFFYIDDAVISEEKLQIEEGDSDYYLTLDSSESVKFRLALAQYMMDKLKAEFPQWRYVLRLKKIGYFKPVNVS